MSVSLLPFIPAFAGRKTLTPRDRIVVRAIAQAMFAQDGEVERERLDAHIEDVDQFISSASRPLRFGLRIALFIVRVAPMLLLFRMRTIEQLTIDERVLVLSRLERSRLANLSLAFIGWRTVMTLVFYEHPFELHALGYRSDREVYKRHLALMPSPVLASIAAAQPPAAESGVRLRDTDSGHPAVASATGKDQVA